MPTVFNKFVPGFDYHLAKVNEVEKEILEKLKGISILQSLFLAYQKIDDKVFLNENFLELFTSFNGKPELQEIITMFLAYITPRTELSVEEIEAKAKKLFNNTENSVIMSTYDSIIAKGKIEGILKTLRIGKLSVEEISEDFEVAVSFVFRIKKENNL